MRYAFRVDTYETERLKLASICSEFKDEDLSVRPSNIDKRGPPTIYACAAIDALLAGEVTGGNKSALPGLGGKPVTERPDH